MPERSESQLLSLVVHCKSLRLIMQYEHCSSFIIFEYRTLDKAE